MAITSCLNRDRPWRSISIIRSVTVSAAGTSSTLLSREEPLLGQLVPQQQPSPSFGVARDVVSTSYWPVVVDGGVQWVVPAAVAEAPASDRRSSSLFLALDLG